MYERDEMPTQPYPALAAQSRTLEASPVPASCLSTSLPIGADEAYRLMGQSERIPEWMAVVRSARTLTRYLDGRPERVAFIANLQRASMGYTLRYSYDDSNRQITWCTPPAASTRIRGQAIFAAMGPQACMLHYEIELQKSEHLPAWNDSTYNDHPASSVLSDFREFVQRHG